MMKKLTILSSILLLIYCGGGKENISSSHDHETGSASHEYEEEEAALEEHEHEDLHVSLAKQKAWGIVIQQPSKQNIISRITLPGVLLLNQNRTAHISSFIPGQISSISVDLGKKVKGRQTLLVINSPEFAQAQADFLQARAKYNLSEKDSQRAQRLYQEKAIEEREYLRREAEHEKLATEYGALGSKLHSYGMTHEQIDGLIQKCKAVAHEEYKCEVADPFLPILTPLSGTVIHRDAIVGDHIKPEKILFTISDLSRLWATLDAYEKDFPHINKDSRVYIHSQLYPDKRFAGKITYISDLIDEKLRTLKVRVEVVNSENLLKPNMYILGTVENQVLQEEALAVPEEAIQNLNGEKIVFVLEEEDVFSVTHVQVGKKVGPDRIITAGLQEDAKVVIKGAFSLKTELTKAQFGQEHVH